MKKSLNFKETVFIFVALIFLGFNVIKTVDVLSPAILSDWDFMKPNDGIITRIVADTGLLCGVMLGGLEIFVLLTFAVKFLLEKRTGDNYRLLQYFHPRLIAIFFLFGLTFSVMTKFGAGRFPVSPSDVVGIIVFIFFAHKAFKRLSAFAPHEWR